MSSLRDSYRAVATLLIGVLAPALLPGAETLRPNEVIAASPGQSVPPPTFTVERGFYSAPFQVVVWTATPGARVVYTLDGSAPSATNGVAAPGTNVTLRITNTTLLRATALQAGLPAAPVQTHTYLFAGKVGAQQRPPGVGATWPGGYPADFQMDARVITNALPGYGLLEALTGLPCLSVVLRPSDLWDSARGIYANPLLDDATAERPASLEWICGDGRPGFQANAGIAIRGLSSRQKSFTPKHSFTLTFRGEYGLPKLRFPLLDDTPVQEFNSLALRGNILDSWVNSEVNYNHLVDGELRWYRTRAGYVRDQWMRDAQIAQGRLASHGRFVHLFLNGSYWGLYNLGERIDEHFAAFHLGGEAEEYDVVTDGQLRAGTTNAWNQLMSLSGADLAQTANYQRLLGNRADGVRNPSYPVLLDLTNLVDYMILHIYAGADDWPWHNWHAVRRRTPDSPGFQFCAWDQEISINSLVKMHTDSGDLYAEVSSPNTPAYVYSRCRANAEFRQFFADRIQRHLFNGGALCVSSNRARYEARAAEIDHALVAESARWGDFYRPAQPYRREVEWLGTNEWMRTAFFPSNHFIALKRFRDAKLWPALAAPQFSRFGGGVPAGFALEMAHTNDAGAILFTTDGADPRRPGGSVSGSVQSYEAPVLISAVTLVRARVRSGANWSPIVEAMFYPPQDLTGLGVSEIMYHPPARGTNDGDNYEFLELQNTGATTLDLSGLTFTAGLGFTFTNGTRLAPGAHFLLVRNPARFLEKYPGVAYQGVFSGKLDNQGETLRLSYPAAAGGGTVLEIAYEPRAPWPLAADGLGFSMAPRAAFTGLEANLGANWRASALPGGSPGTNDPPSAVPPLVVNEILSHSDNGLDFIELFNPTTNRVDLGGWFLTDDPASPRKYRFPDGATLGPLGFRAVTQTEFDPAPGSSNSFAFNLAGDEVCLLSGDAATNLTGYSHGFTFGAAAPGVTFGRYVLSTGEEQFVLQERPTPGLPNAGPRIGPVVITEIHYHPAAGQDEFIELKNITTNPVALFAPAAPAQAWRIHGPGFGFPTNLTLAAGQVLLVVATVPEAFRAKYGLTLAALVLGPFSGSLQNDGERLALQQPCSPDTPSGIYVDVDVVRYGDRWPWPAAADGSGASLQRKQPAGFGNDPANWEAAPPTPGSDFVAGETPVILQQPQPQVAVAGQTVTFGVQADGPPPLRFQWCFEGKALPGATQAVLMLSNVLLSQAGAYSVAVSSPGGTLLSSPATLTVREPLAALVTPMNQFVRAGSNATFSASVSSDGIVRFQWQFNGTNLPGATGPTLTITNAQARHEGPYQVVVTDSFGSVTSAAATLALLFDPVILQSPLSQQVAPGGTVVFCVTVTNNATLPLGYRWRTNGVFHPALFFVSNERTSYLTLGNLQPGLAACAVVVTNAAKPIGLLSATATVTFLLDADSDGLPDEWETRFGLDANSAADRDADPDGDGFANGQEYVAGTDPGSASSVLKVDRLEVAASATRLEFYAASNRTYTVQSADAPGGTFWTRLADVPARPTNGPVVVPDFSTRAGQRFYRVVCPRQP